MDSFYETLMCFLELDSYNSLIDLFGIPLMIYFHGFGNSDSENWKHMCSMVVLLNKSVSGIYQKGTWTKNGTKQRKSQTNLITTALIFSNKVWLYLISNFLLIRKYSYYHATTAFNFLINKKWQIIWNGKRRKKNCDVKYMCIFFNIK